MTADDVYDEFGEEIRAALLGLYRQVYSSLTSQTAGLFGRCWPTCHPAR